MIDLVIGACSLELGYAIATSNVRDFNRIPGLTILQLSDELLTGVRGRLQRCTVYP